MTHLPKVIFIDWNKTLSNSLFWSHLSKENNHKYSKYHPKIIEVLFSTNKHLIYPWMRGEYTSKEITDIISTDVGLSSEILHDELSTSCRQQSFVDFNIPDLINKIQKKDIFVVIATDNMDTFRKCTVPSMNLENIFDDILISHELGLLKEDHDEKSIPFFDEYLSKHDLDYSDAVLLDDCTDDTGVYDKLGLNIIQITGPEILLNSLKKYAS